MRCQLFIDAIDASAVCAEDVNARLWTDVGDTGSYIEMGLVTDGQSAVVPDGNNLVFESTAFDLSRTGAFNYTVEFSADSHVEAGRKEWISLNDLAKNSDGVVVVSPQWVRQGPTIAEGDFRSGTLADITRRLAEIPADVIYLLPFFRPGFVDLHTGDEVRKGSLGSVYAVRDFFQIDPELVSPLANVDLAGLVEEGLVRPGEVDDMEAFAGM